MYSGKKTHTIKNLVIGGLHTRKVNYLSQTYEGKRHDKKIADEEAPTYPKDISLYFDCLRTVVSLYSMVPIGYAVSNDTGEQAHCVANAWPVHAAHVMSFRTDTRCTRSPRCPSVSAVTSSLASIFFPRWVSVTRNRVNRTKVRKV